MLEKIKNYLQLLEPEVKKFEEKEKEEQAIREKALEKTKVTIMERQVTESLSTLKIEFYLRSCLEKLMSEKKHIWSDFSPRSINEMVYRHLIKNKPPYPFGQNFDRYNFAHEYHPHFIQQIRQQLKKK